MKLPLACFVFCSFICTFALSSLNMGNNIEVTAHRGASINYPENTILSFKEAQKLKADWIELDVQQTKDGFIVVIHDRNLERTTGVSKKVIDTNLEEIMSLDAGSYLNNKFKDAKIPLFEDVIKWAKENNVKLNVELKPSKKSIDFEKKVLDIINKYEYKDKCVIASQKYESLSKVKEIDESYKTVYVANNIEGDILSYDAADDYSLEYSIIDKKLIDYIHKASKKVYAWTLDTEDMINEMIDLGVDNIITDDVILSRNIFIKRNMSFALSQHIDLLETIFAI